MRALGEDLVAGLRAVRRRPGLAAAVVGILAAGIGSVVTVFSVVDAFFLRPLPYPEAGRLVWIRSLHGGNPAGVSYADYLDLERAPDLADTALFSANDFSVLSVAGEAESALATRTTASLFSVLRVRPWLGRAWPAGEDRPDAGRSVVLSHALWRLRFAADPAAIGRSVMVDGAPYTVAGVMPPGFHFPVRSDLWISSSPWADQRPWRDIRVGTMVARLRPGATLDAARAELGAISACLEREYPATNSGIRAEALPLREVWTQTSRAGLLVLLSACCLLLSIACANAASLLLVWAGAREVDTAVRIAVGIRPSRLVRQATVEAVLLGLASGAAGLLVASWGVRLVARLLPGQQLPSWIEIRLDARSAVLAMTLSLLVGLLAGLTPALRSRTVPPQALLRNTGMAGGASRETGRRRKGLAVAELALSLWLLASAGLVLESFSRLQAVDAGFGTRGVLAAEVQLPALRLAGYQQVTALYRRLLERLQALPGVTAVGAATDLPLTPRETRILWELGVAGQAPDERRRNPAVRGHVVSPGYFQALGLAFLEGRGFEPRDTAHGTAGAIVSRSFAERFWPRRPAVGQALSLGAPGSHAPPMTVVGVVADVRYEHRSVAGDGLDLYVPLERLPSWPIQLVVRTRGRPLAVAAAVRRAVRSVSPDLAVRDAVPLAARVDRSLWRERMWATLLPIFAGVALLLSACGVYGAISHRVRQRSREIGIRLALGAVRRDVLRLVLGELAGICALGVGLGLLGCVASGRFLGALLYEVGSEDPVVLALTAAVLVASSLVACAIPLRRVLRIEPATALRWE